jgi:predicted phosphodiesterase
MLGGDLISGDIHEELQDTNEAQTLDTVLHWSSRIAAGVEELAGEFGRVHVPVVVGNHGRRSRKPRAKGRARDNFDWLIGQLIARQFHADERVTFDIPDGTDTLVAIHDSRFLLTHGDQVSGGGGIGGHWPPLMRLIAKKRNRYTFDALCCGHWHSQIMSAGQGLIVNGTTKGEDEYSSIMGFKSEPPQQALFTVAPEHGVTFSAPVLVSAGRKREGW